MKIPAGYVLTNAEVAAVLQAAEERKRAGAEPTFVEEADGVVVRMPVETAVSQADLRVAITRLNDAAAYGHADVTFTFADGRLVKKGWILLKDQRDNGHRSSLVGGGEVPRLEF